MCIRDRDGTREVGVEVYGQLTAFYQSIQTALQALVIGVEQDTILVVKMCIRDRVM